MISKLEVKNFKSIKHLILNCNKVNIFIGKGGDKDQKIFNFIFEYNYEGAGNVSTNKLSPIKFYKFVSIESFPNHNLDFLLPPGGENLLSLLFTDKDLRKLISVEFVSIL